jgi:hypothetical protein
MIPLVQLNMRRLGCLWSDGTGTQMLLFAQPAHIGTGARALEEHLGVRRWQTIHP